jgi:hypothetical protein
LLGAPAASHELIIVSSAEVTQFPPFGMLPPSDPQRGEVEGSTS